MAGVIFKYVPLNMLYAQHCFMNNYDGDCIQCQVQGHIVFLSDFFEYIGCIMYDHKRVTSILYHIAQQTTRHVHTHKDEDFSWQLSYTCI